MTHCCVIGCRSSHLFTFCGIFVECGLGFGGRGTGVGAIRGEVSYWESGTITSQMTLLSFEKSIL